MSEKRTRAERPEPNDKQRSCDRSSAAPVRKVWNIMTSIDRQFPGWPSTFSPCECQRASGRGGGPCTFCLVEELAEQAGKELAEEYLTKRASLSDTYEQILIKTGEWQ